jgi:hypothetical protein
VNPGAVIAKRKVFHYFLPKADEIQLKTCKNAWVPSCLRVKDTNDNCQLLSEEDVLIEVHIILNNILIDDYITSSKIDCSSC